MGGASALLILGVAAASIIQCVQSRLSARGKRADSDAQDHMLHANDLQPKNASVPQQTTLEQVLDDYIAQIERDTEKFKKIIHDPDEPLYDNVLTRDLAPYFNDGTHQAKINHFWVYLNGMHIAFESSLEDLNRNKNTNSKNIILKRNEIARLTDILLCQRRESYREFIQKCNSDTLLTEAKLILCFMKNSAINPQEDLEQRARKQTAIEREVQQMTLETILPELQNIAFDKERTCFEVQELVSAIDTKLNGQEHRYN